MWLVTGHADMRKGFDCLALIIQETLKRDPYSDHLFVFRGRRGQLATGCGRQGGAGSSARLANLNAIVASAVVFEGHPFDRIVPCRTVAKVLSILRGLALSLHRKYQPRCRPASSARMVISNAKAE